MDLFEHAQRYPSRPGWKARDTSRAAAQAMASEAPALQVVVFNILYDFRNGLTADEIAKIARRDKLAIRPRLTELFVLGKIEPTGATRPNASGKQARVWRIRP